MNTNKDLLVKGIKYLGFTIVLMFSAPIVLYQAFKNTEHAFYIPILIIGGLLAIAAIAMGFYSIKVFIDALFGDKKK